MRARVQSTRNVTGRSLYSSKSWVFGPTHLCTLILNAEKQRKHAVVRRSHAAAVVIVLQGNVDSSKLAVRSHMA